MVSAQRLLVFVGVCPSLLQAAFVPLCGVDRTRTPTTRSGVTVTPVTSKCKSTSSRTNFPDSSAIRMSDRDETDAKIRLREEAESPFRKVRFFAYLALAGGALTSLLVSGARVAAALAGVNTDLMDESIRNAGIDLVGLIILAVLFQRDLQAQESRIKRASKGAELAKLMIRANKSLSDSLVEPSQAQTFTTSLSSLRRGRGIEKRVVIAVAGKDKIDQVVEEAKRLDVSLSANDLVIVPVVMPNCAAPILDDQGGGLPESLALPVGRGWNAVVDDETQEARNQGVDVERDGVSIILKKNGRVGQRTRGVFLANMVGDVEERRALGMDVKNI